MRATPRDAIPTKRILRGPAVSLASQATGLVQLALLVLRAGANQATDAYLYLFNAGMVPILCIVVGMMYPSLLNERRLSRAGLRAIRRWTPCLCVVFVLGAAGWLAYQERLPGQLYPLAFCATLLAVAQARVWFRAVAAEAEGNPLWISGIALVPNLLAVLALLPPWGSPAVVTTVMVAALVAGNVGLSLVMARHRVGDSVVAGAPDESAAGAGHLWFLSLSAVGYMGQLFLQSLAVLLPASSVTVLNLGVKVVGSTSATFVNASMPVLVHQRTESPAAARRFLRIVLVIVGIAAAALVATVGIGWPELLAPAAAVGLWLIASSAQTVVFRMSYRFLPPRSLTRTIGVVVGVAILAGVSAGSTGFDIRVALCAFAMLDAASAFLLLLPLRDRWASAVLAAVVLGLAGIWIAPYV